ncbi:MAG: hypothetical protein ABFD70_13500 [Syntrophaceae bacterium]|nr:hypothetical protein [Deltaproteobacteria bacterium]
MKIARIIGMIFFLTTIVLASQTYAADEKDDSSASRDQGWFCPWAGQGYDGMGPGMMGRGYGPGGGWGHGGMMGYGPGYGYHSYNRSGKSMTMEQTKLLVEHYLTSMGNPNLKMGKITDKEKYFEAEIVTKDGSLVDTLMVDKQTGWMKSVY